MPIREKVVKSELTGAFDTFLSDKRREKAVLLGKDEGDTDFLNIIEFIEKFNLLPQGLFPVQRFIVKLYYNIKLDDKIPDDEKDQIRITDKFGGKVLRILSEVEYLQYLYDQGRCNIKEQTPRDRRELILVIGRRSGKCSKLHTSLLYTDQGILKLSDLIKHREVGWRDLGVKITQESGKQTITDGVYYGGVQDVRTFKTYCGYGLSATPEHRVKVLSESGSIEWRYLRDLKIGDHIGINRSSTLWATDRVDVSELYGSEFKVDARFGEFLGILVGDGTWSSGKNKSLIQVTGGCEQFLPFVVGHFEEFLGDHHIHRKLPSKNNTCEISPWRITKCNVKFRSFLDKIGYRLNATKGDKSVPWVIFRSPKKVVAAFLRGLFETDGGMEKGNTITFCSHSEQLCKDVQILLLNFGIICRYKGKYNKRFNSTNYILNILGGHSRKKFAEEIGFITNRKNQILLESLETVTSGSSDTESIPNIRQLLRDLRESIPKSTNNTKGTIFSDRSRCFFKDIVGDVLRPKSKLNLSYERLGRAVAYARDSGADPKLCDHLSNIIACDYFWDPVVSIVEERAEVGDVSVPDGHEYVANGMTNHNSLLSSIFASYEMYKLLRRGHPQSYYGAPSGNEIRVLCIANDKEQASIVYGEMLSHIEAVDYFKSSIANSTQTFIKFRTEHDKEAYGVNGRGSVVATFKSSIAKGLRGRGIICAILDEIAFYVDNGTSSGERVYKAIVPSIAQFSPKDPKNKHKPATLSDGRLAPSDGRIILISSPDAREGFFYRQYQTAMSDSKASENTLMIQAPTWEVNPTLSPDYYEIEYHKDPRSFMTEHGAEFSDRVRGWVEDYKVLSDCINPGQRPQMSGYPREPHFCGFDLGLTNDGSAVALTRLHKGKIELVYHEIWYPKVKWSDSNPHLAAIGMLPLTPYAHLLQNQTRLDLVEVSEWLLQLSKLFYITKGVFDQWTGIVLEQELHRRQLTQFEMRNFFTSHSSQAYQTFKMFMYNKQLSLYDFPLPQNATGESSQIRHSPLITEILELQATSGGKNIVIVEAPDSPGKHDDQSDALARSIMLAAEHIQAHPGILDTESFIGSTQMSRPGRAPSYNQYHRSRSRLHGGTPTERRVPRGGGRIIK